MEAVPSKSSVSYINKHWSSSATTILKYSSTLRLRECLVGNALRNIKRKDRWTFDNPSLSEPFSPRKRNILDYDGLLPVFCHVTDKTHEVTVAREQTKHLIGGTMTWNGEDKEEKSRLCG